MRRARQFVSSIVSAAHADGPVDDLLVAVSELCTNVVEHTDVRDFGLRIELSPELVELHVFDRGSPVASPADDEPVMPPPTSLQGRGLAIAAQLVDHLRIHLSPEGGWGVTIRQALPMDREPDLVAPSP